MFKGLLDGKSAIVTGAGRGIGRDIAIAMAEAGCNVALVSRTQGQLEETCGQISSIESSPMCITVPCDITKEGVSKDIVNEVLSSLGGIDILINCAGTFVMKPFIPGMKNNMSAVPGFDIPLSNEEWYRQMDTNVTGAFNLTREAVSGYMAEYGGKIVFISSIDAVKGMAYHAAYAASKGAITSLTKSLAAELGRFDINVNCICPGFVHTDMTDFAHSDKKIRTVMENMSPLRRVTRTHDVAWLAVFLSSVAADCITGQVICADCGVTC